MKTAIEILEELRGYFGEKSIRQLALKISGDDKLFYNITGGKTKKITKAIALEIVSKYPEINKEYLMKGEGEMFVKENKKTVNAELGEGIPLIPVDAFAGAALNNGYSVDFDRVEERYTIPLFDGKGVDFMIHVRGSSMYPKYSNGDIVACRFVRELLFVQWNKVYVLDTKSQGAMIKRLIRSESKDKVICRSENKDYGDFEVPLSDINNIALVVGCIRLD